MGKGFSGDSVVKDLPVNSGDVGWIPGSGRFLGEGNGNPLQYSYLGNPTDKRTWQATVPWDLKRVRHDLATKRQHKFGDIEIYLMVLAQRQFRKKFSFLSEVLRTKERIAMMNKNISTKKELSKQFSKYL